jgi:hypothetical protein
MTFEMIIKGLKPGLKPCSVTDLLKFDQS